MTRFICTAVVLFMVTCFPAFALAEGAPDAWVKGQWIKIAGLPAEANLEDMSQSEEEPYFLGTFGGGNDNPHVVVAVGRSPRSELAENLARLDKGALAEFVGEEDFLDQVKDLKFIPAPFFAGKIAYPCQMATYTDPDLGRDNAILFIQTDGYLFHVLVHWSSQAKKYGRADIDRWLASITIVEQ